MQTVWSFAQTLFLWLEFLILNCEKQSCFTDCFSDQREWQQHEIYGVNEVMERSGITECSR
jgi:hypothetical protein